MHSELPVHRYTAGLVFIGVVSLGAEGGEAILEVTCELFLSGLAVEVVLLIGIGMKIVELPLLRLDEEVYEFVAVGADAAAGAHILEAGKFVVLV